MTAIWKEIRKRTKNFTVPAVIPSSIIKTNSIFEFGDIIELANKIYASGNYALNIDGSYIVGGGKLPNRRITKKNYVDYFIQAASLNNGNSITLTRDYCLSYSRSISTSTKNFIQGYINYNGVPISGVNAVFISGKYKSTWIGLHNDFCETFLFTIKGKKNMKVWPPEYFNKISQSFNPVLNGICIGHCDISKYEKDSITFEIEEGELFFIPANWWHYNILPEEQVTFTISLGIFKNIKYGEFVKKEVDSIIQTELLNNDSVCFRPPPKSNIHSLNRITLPQPIENFIEELRERIAVKLLISATKNGVVNYSRFKAKPLEELIRAKIIFLSSAPIYYCNLRKNVMIFADGSFELFPTSYSLTKWLDKLFELKKARILNWHNLDVNQKNILHWLRNLSVIKIEKIK